MVAVWSSHFTLIFTVSFLFLFIFSSFRFFSPSIYLFSLLTLRLFFVLVYFFWLFLIRRIYLVINKYFLKIDSTFNLYLYLLNFFMSFYHLIYRVISPHINFLYYVFRLGLTI